MRFGLRHRSQEFSREIRRHLARNFKHRCICNSFAAVFVLKFNSASGYFLQTVGVILVRRRRHRVLEIPHALKFDLI